MDPINFCNSENEKPISVKKLPKKKGQAGRKIDQ